MREFLLIFFFVLLLIIAFAFYLIFKQKSPSAAKEAKCSMGYWMGTGIAIGFACGMAIGIVIGIVMKNVAIGVALGGGFGTAFGTALGAALENKHQDELRPVSEIEQKIKKWIILTALITVLIGAAFLLFFISQS